MDSAAASQRVPRRHWSLLEKQRIVELTQQEGASIGAIAHEHGVHATVVSQWRRLFRDGKLADSSSQEATRNATTATFLPVTMKSDDALATSSIHITWPSGIMLRIETPQLDAQILCTLLAQMQR